MRILARKQNDPLRAKSFSLYASRHKEEQSQAAEKNNDETAAVDVSNAAAAAVGFRTARALDDRLLSKLHDDSEKRARPFAVKILHAFYHCARCWSLAHFAC